MSIKDLRNKTASVAARPVTPNEDAEPRTTPVRMYDTTMRMHEAERRAEELEQKLKAALAEGHTNELELDALIEVEGRRRHLSQEEFSDLVENLRNNDLVTPITVRPSDIESGKYEIVSGHNRVSAYRKLGRERIPAVVQQADKIRADLNSFYANLLQPSLPDYEKYLGFSMIKERNPELTQEAIADMVGLSRQQVGRLMSFAGLPPEAHAVLRANVSALGASAAAELASLAGQGKAEKVTEAITQLSDGKIDQSQALKLAREETQPVKRPAPEIIKIKSGKAVFCSMRRADKTIRLDFKSSAEAEEIQEAIRTLLENKAAK